MKTKNIVFGVTLLGVSYISYLYLKRPKATINISDDDSGDVTLGQKSKTFDVQKSETLKDGAWQITASANAYDLKFLGMSVEKRKGSFIEERDTPTFKKMVGKMVQVNYNY